MVCIGEFSSVRRWSGLKLMDILDILSLWPPFTSEAVRDIDYVGVTSIGFVVPSIVNGSFRIPGSGGEGFTLPEIGDGGFSTPSTGDDGFSSPEADNEGFNP